MANEAGFYLFLFLFYCHSTSASIYRWEFNIFSNYNFKFNRLLLCAFISALYALVEVTLFDFIDGTFNEGRFIAKADTERLPVYVVSFSPLRRIETDLKETTPDC